ncbi:hypothetical protein ACFQL7_02010 [Halocatena marina]|uniref:Uncharacterized protein n=1 Tax=Halocatena marina TaxID=2934937 RepID=A0ABD5YNJ0_9EURY
MPFVSETAAISDVDGRKSNRAWIASLVLDSFDPGSYFAVDAG